MDVWIEEEAIGQEANKKEPVSCLFYKRKKEKWEVRSVGMTLT